MFLALNYFCNKASSYIFKIVLITPLSYRNGMWYDNADSTRGHNISEVQVKY